VEGGRSAAGDVTDVCRYSDRSLIAINDDSDITDALSTQQYCSDK